MIDLGREWPVSEGFIRARQRDAFTWKMRHATEWVLTEFPFAGTPPTKDFMRWRPGDVLTERPPPDARPPTARDEAQKSGSRTGNSGHADRIIRSAPPPTAQSDRIIRSDYRK
jgi:hypothetical protein